MKSAIPRSQSVHWGTPLEIICRVQAALGSIELDPCANKYSEWGSLRNCYGMEDDDGLAISWLPYETIFVNPPFGRGIEQWLAKCDDTYARGGNKIIAIFPGSTETIWFQRMLHTATALCLPAKRIKYVSNPLTPQREDQPTKGSALAYWGPSVPMFFEAFKSLGYCIQLTGA